MGFFIHVMDIKKYLDSTYLKTSKQAGITKSENMLVAQSFIQEAINEDFKLIMIRPDMVSLAKKMIVEANSKVNIGNSNRFSKRQIRFRI